MNTKVLNFSLIIITILIVVIFASEFYIITKSRATRSVFDDIKTDNISETSQDEIASNENMQSSSSNDDFNAEKIYPFTGAFPEVDAIAYICKDNSITEFSNEDILRLGFAKVTKDDWADSYTAEGSPVSIPASLLDEYIKDIFGQDVVYTKANFSNTSYSISKDGSSPTSSYNVTYVPETDSYTINHVTGDGIGENFISFINLTTSKIKGNVEIEAQYVFVVPSDEETVTKEVNGEQYSSFEYTVYANYDFETKTFSGELGKFSEFDVEEDGSFNMSNQISNICSGKENQMQTLEFLYESNENGEQVLKEIK
jgi:hypothetical protein